ncbi:hypothetical protein [Exiguobacterium algae]|uniref:hypothetical protein n=1 Tax=Exiguobacterium algae TaxID=2751250 RepID=UPI001BE92024|nr:hypothetical protein [Exiguobacterium algae]
MTKTVGVKSYRTTKKIAGTVKTKVQQRFTRKSTAKTPGSSSVSQRNAKTEARYVKNERKTESTTQGADETAATSELGAKGAGKNDIIDTPRIGSALKNDNVKPIIKKGRL